MRRLSSLGCVLVLAGSLAAQQPDGRPASIPDLIAAALRDSNDAVAHYRLAMGYWDKKKLDDAERALNRALVVAPSYPDAHLALGVLPERRGEGYWNRRQKQLGKDSVVAELLEYHSHYRRAFLINPMVDLRVLGKFEGEEGLSFRVVGGRIYAFFAPWYSRDLARSANEFREGRYAKALEQLDKLIRDRRSGGEDAHAPTRVLWFHGLAAAHLDQFETAIRDFAILTRRHLDREQDTTTESIGLKSNDYRYILATLLYLDGRFGQAIPTFRRALELDLGLYPAHVQLARMYEARGDLDAALAERRLALDVQQDDPDLLIDLAGTLIKAGRLEEALQPLADAARLNPHDVRVPYLQASVAESLHDSTAARRAYARFIAVAPSRFATQVEDAAERLNALSATGNQ